MAGWRTIRKPEFLGMAAAFALLATSAPAQLLDGADWFERELGSGVVWKAYLFEDLFGSRQCISYIEADLDNPNVNIEFPYLAMARQRTSTMVPDQFPDAVGGLNGTYFNTSTGGHRTYLRVGGVEVPPAGDLFSSWGYEGAIALDASDNTSIIPIPAGGWANDTTHPDIMACGPLVVVNGVVPSDDLDDIGSHCTARHPRSAVGVTADNKLILLAVDGRTEMSAGMTCEELGLIMDELGCVGALNLDGGGSTTLWGAGEQYNGVLNYPTDNGQFDHEGERSCSNAIAIESTAAQPAEYDARLLSKNYTPTMDTGTQQQVSLVYENIGTETWTAADTKVMLARPSTRTSEFQHSSWISATQPAVMTPATVAPGETATFNFTLQAPTVTVTEFHDEHFMLVHDGTRIGPADHEAWMQLVVEVPVAPGDDFIVESRLGGQNFGWYSDSGMASTSVDCTAPGSTPNIGTRYGSTFVSVAGAKHATVAPEFPTTGLYDVYVAWPAGSSRRSPITYHVNHLGGTSTFQLDQTINANTWVRLGESSYLFKEGFNGSVVMTNEDIDVSGSMYAGGVKFDFQEQPATDKSYNVKFTGIAPGIDGAVTGAEWSAAASAMSGFVAHDNPAVPATEDASVRMMYDEDYLYILAQMNNAYLPGYPAPPATPAFADLAGDKFDFFFAPFGPSTAPFYRILLSPNPTDGKCHVWSQASLERTTDANTGTGWIAGGDAAYTYSGGLLTVEYRVPWTAFNYGDMALDGAPEAEVAWGAQPSVTNQVTAGNFEYVNWEPDETPSFVHGIFGTLNFQAQGSRLHGWMNY